MSDRRLPRCQWIEPDCDVVACLDRGEPYLSCDRPAEPGSSYCADHRARTVVRQCQWPGCELKPVNGTRLCRRHHAERLARLYGKGAAA